MQDFNKYSYTLKESEVLSTIREAKKYNCDCLLVLNGEYYDIVLETPVKSIHDESEIF